MISFCTPVLDGMPWIAKHIDVFSKLTVPWRWIIVEGVSDNVHCTSWCNKLPPRLSRDGTTEYLDGLKDPRVTVLRRELWPGKAAMFNEALALVKDDCFVWQVDADEIWTPEQITAVVNLFEKRPEANCAYFWCKFFLGPDIIVANHDSWSNNPLYEWKRVWRFKPGMKFITHEPPVMSGMTEMPITHAETEAVGAVFDHYAYATLPQAEFKQLFYSGKNNPVGHKYGALVEGWKRLQTNSKWPVALSEFFAFVPNDTIAARI